MTFGTHLVHLNESEVVAQFPSFCRCCKHF